MAGRWRCGSGRDVTSWSGFGRGGGVLPYRGVSVGSEFSVISREEGYSHHEPKSILRSKEP